MAKKPRMSEIQAMQRCLRDEPSDAEGSSEASGSFDDLVVQPDVDTGQL